MSFFLSLDEQSIQHSVDEISHEFVKEKKLPLDKNYNLEIETWTINDVYKHAKTEKGDFKSDLINFLVETVCEQFITHDYFEYRLNNIWSSRITNANPEYHILFIVAKPNANHIFNKNGNKNRTIFKRILGFIMFRFDTCWSRNFVSELSVFCKRKSKKQDYAYGAYLLAIFLHIVAQKKPWIQYVILEALIGAKNLHRYYKRIGFVEIPKKRLKREFSCLPPSPRESGPVMILDLDNMTTQNILEYTLYKRTNKNSVSKEIRNLITTLRSKGEMYSSSS